MRSSLSGSDLLSNCSGLPLRLTLLHCYHRASRDTTEDSRPDTTFGLDIGNNRYPPPRG